MQFFQNLFTKIDDYFTANQGRKIFFYGIIATAVSFTLYVCFYFQFFYVLSMFSLVVLAVGTLWDSMYTRYLFLKKIQELQYNHLKEITDKQSAGENVVMTPTFTEDEKRYLRRRKWIFVMVIFFKVALVIALFSLLLHMQMS